MAKQDKKIENIEELLALSGEDLNILEEEVDVTVQREYIDLARLLTKDEKYYLKLRRSYREHAEDLFDEKVVAEVKKRMLIVLATIDDVAAYRVIELFSKEETPLQKWAVIALQQSRMLLQSSLLDNPGIFISSGLGGQGQLLRYFCVFLNREKEVFQAYQQKIIKNEVEATVKAASGYIESIEFKKDFAIVLLLLPLQISLKNLFSGLIDECNLYGNFLDQNLIVTNVKKLSDEEIRLLARGEGKMDMFY